MVNQQPNKKRKRSDQPEREDREEKAPTVSHLPAYTGKNTMVAHLIETVQDGLNKDLRNYISMQRTKYKITKQIEQLEKGLLKKSFNIKVTLQPFKDMEENPGQLQRQAQEALEAKAIELQASYKTALETHLHSFYKKQEDFMTKLQEDIKEKLIKICAAVVVDGDMSDEANPLVNEAMKSITEGLQAFKMKQAAKTLDLQTADQQKVAAQEERKQKAQEAMKDVEPMRKSIENYIDKRIKAKTKSKPDRKTSNGKADKGKTKKDKQTKRNKGKGKKAKPGTKRSKAATNKGHENKKGNKQRQQSRGQGNGRGKRERQRR